jgi:hypothetical protein
MESDQVNNSRIEHIVILGCGPAGIFAAHAAKTAGVKFSIYSRKRRSEMFGAQYLHEPIPGLSQTAPREIGYSLMGTAEQYAAKVYGDERPPFVSPDSLVGRHKGWDIREAYYRGWEAYQDDIIDVAKPIDWMSFTDGRTFEHDAIRNAYQAWPYVQIISTIPAHFLCSLKGKHTFRARKVWAVGDAPERGQMVDIQVPPEEVICNGEPSPSWYRAANVFGHKTIEWPHDQKPPVSNVAEVEKVIDTDCDCLQPTVWKAGRLGAWNKRWLSHHAYYTTLDVMRLVGVNAA